MDRETVIAQFHKAFGHPTEGGLIDNACIALRIKLMEEELNELLKELEQVMRHNLYDEDIPVELKARVLKEMADLQVVLSGSAVAFGMPLQAAFIRVNKSNMSKLPLIEEDCSLCDGSGDEDEFELGEACYACGGTGKRLVYGKPMFRDDGKLLKGASYQPPALDDLVK